MYDSRRSFESPAGGTVQPTLSDATDETLAFRSLLILDSGGSSVAIKFTSINDITDTITIPASVTMAVLPVYIKRIWSTGTTLAASSMRGLV